MSCFISCIKCCLPSCFGSRSGMNEALVSGPTPAELLEGRDVVLGDYFENGGDLDSITDHFQRIVNDPTKNAGDRFLYLENFQNCIRGKRAYDHESLFGTFKIKLFGKLGTGGAINRAKAAATRVEAPIRNALDAEINHAAEEAAVDDICRMRTQIQDLEKQIEAEKKGEDLRELREWEQDNEQYCSDIGDANRYPDQFFAELQIIADKQKREIETRLLDSGAMRQLRLLEAGVNQNKQRIKDLERRYPGAALRAEMMAQAQAQPSNPVGDRKEQDSALSAAYQMFDAE